ncbi:prepilin-type N-terminal cleavage/methylation domain-containing protein [Neobacillus sp. 3P2-tot-E-2]|uniref:PilW family protein n=1 Tax=Neobacillus sp. 3P2-tot-E-2 TaxID=3132212 RepID=UPI0039A0862C
MEKRIMRFKLNNNNGLTLIEVLGAFTLLSLILIMASSVHFFAQNQAKKQSDEIANQTNARLAMKVITKEIRSADELDIYDGTKKYSVDRLGYITEQINNSPIGLTISKNGTTTIYVYENNTLKRNSQPYITNLQNFELKVNLPKVNQISISVANLPVTTISIRK